MTDKDNRNIKEICEVAKQLSPVEQEALIRLGRDLIFIEHVKNAVGK